MCLLAPRHPSLISRFSGVSSIWESYRLVSKPPVTSSMGSNAVWIAALWSSSWKGLLGEALISRFSEVSSTWGSYHLVSKPPITSSMWAQTQYGLRLCGRHLGKGYLGRAAGPASEWEPPWTLAAERGGLLRSILGNRTHRFQGNEFCVDRENPHFCTFPY